MPGKPLFFATAMPLGGAATGLLVESHRAGRPRSRATRASGEPRRDRRLRAGVGARLYDPDRSQVVRQRRRDPHLGAPSRTRSRAALEAQARARRRRPAHPHRDGHLADAGRADRGGCSTKLPAARAGTSTSRCARDNARRRRAARLRRATSTRIYRFDQRRRDPLARRRLPRRAAPASVRYAREFVGAAPRRAAARRDMNRLYVVERTPTITGAHGRPPPAAAGRARSTALARAVAAGARASAGAARRRRRRARGLDRGAWSRDLQRAPRRAAW